MAELLRPFAGARSPQLAARLVEQFGSLAAALEASGETLVRLSVEDRQVLEQLHAGRRLADCLAREHLVRDGVSPRDGEFLSYLRRLLASQPRERLHVTFIDHGGGLIVDELLCDGAFAAVELHGRHIVARALELSAYGVILAHNHPSGSVIPSEVDIASTHHLAAILAALDIQLTDHLIVTSAAIGSMRDGGFL